MRLKILTLNVWGVPILAGNIRERLSNFVKQISVIKPDIICLQEVWSLEDKKFVEEQLKDYYSANPSFETRKFLKIFNLNREGGLLTLSRFRIGNTKFYEFEKQDSLRIEEKIAKKGFLKTEIITPSVKLIVINTHLYAGADMNDRNIRIHQLNQLMKFVEKADRKPPLILAGDFNFNPQSPEYNLFINKFMDTLNNLNPVRRESKFSPTLFYRALRFAGKSANKTEEGRLDYIFVKKNEKASINFVNPMIIFKGKNSVSDHYGYSIDLLTLA